MSKYVPSIKVALAAVTAGLVALVQTENTTVLQAVTTFMVAAGPVLGIGWTVPDLNPAPSTVARVLRDRG